MNAPEDAKLRKALDSLSLFEQALARLQEVLALQLSPEAILRDATIQRFAFVIELCWKTLKRFLWVEGVEAYTPREVLKEAFQNHWIEEEALWLSMLNDRNLMSHIYQESQAIEIYNRIPQYYPLLRDLQVFLKQRFAG